MYYDIFIREETWENNKHDELLKKIADDEIRAFFINQKAECIISPYAGGMDVFLKNMQLRDEYKSKYSKWLSIRVD